MSTILPGPRIPQATSDLVVSLDDITHGGGLFIIINQYDNAARGDYIDLIWDGKSVYNTDIFNVNEDFPITFVIKNDLSVGEHLLQYTAKDIVENQSESNELTIIIDDSDTPSLYPAPVFIYAENGELDDVSIAKYNGTDVKILTNENISSGDIIHLFWTKTNASGQSKSFMQSSEVTSDDLINGVIFHLDSAATLIFGDGVISAYYNVVRNDIKLGVSDTATVNITTTEENSTLQLFVTTGASATDYDNINVHPFNQGEVKGSPGTDVELSIVGDAVFNENSSNLLKITIDEYGFYSFKIKSSTQNSVVIYAFDENHPEISVSVESTFGPYWRGNGHLRYINSSTRALANGTTPCSIYLQVDSLAISKVRVNVEGTDAFISGYPDTQWADIDLNSDLSAEINILDTTAERVVVSLSLPEASGSENQVSVVFIADS